MNHQRLLEGWSHAEAVMGTKKLVRGFTKKRHGEEDNDRSCAWTDALRSIIDLFITCYKYLLFFLLNKNSGSHLILNKERIPSKMTWFNNDFRLMTARRTLHNEQSRIIFHLRKWQDISRIFNLINLIILRSLIAIRKVDYAKMHLTVNLWFFKLQISFLS